MNSLKNKLIGVRIAKKIIAITNGETILPSIIPNFIHILLRGPSIFEFIIVKHKSGYFLDCPKYQIENLYKQLTLYKLRSKVEITNLSNEFVVAALSRDKFSEFDKNNNKTGMTIKFREDPVILDPRCIDLEARIVINLSLIHI